MNTSLSALDIGTGDEMRSCEIEEAFSSGFVVELS
jgi:hypothetical protein